MGFGTLLIGKMNTWTEQNRSSLGWLQEATLKPLM
jgi:hypothetical protein